MNTKDNRTGFPAEAKTKMRTIKWVGNTVIDRLEQIGFSSFAQLAEADPDEVTKQISQMMGSTCWHNSPQAKAAIRGVIALAKENSV